MSSPTHNRDGAESPAVQIDPSSDLAERIIEDSWSRCHALAYAASAAPTLDEALQLVSDSLQSADAALQPNRIVSFAAWPLDVLVELGQFELVRHHLLRLGQVIAQEPSPVRRGDGIDALLRIADLLPSREMFELFIREIASCALTPLLNGKRNKRSERLLVAWLLRCSQCDPALAAELVSQMSVESVRARLTASIAAGRGANCWRWRFVYPHIVPTEHEQYFRHHRRPPTA